MKYRHLEDWERKADLIGDIRSNHWETDCLDFYN